MRWLWLLFSITILSAGQAAAQEIKPPIRGLISMGPYKFVGEKPGPPYYRQPQPKNTIAALDGFGGIFGGIVIVASWEQLQPSQDGPLEPGVIDRMLNEIETYNQRHPDRKLYVKLRVWGGFMAPYWAKKINGDPIPFVHNKQLRTIGRFWEKDYRDAFARLQTLLAARYDGHELIREVAVTQCMSFTAEPFFLPSKKDWNVVPVLKEHRFSDERYKECLRGAVDDYGAAWKQTRVVFPFNPYKTTLDGDDSAFTVGVMQHCREKLGTQCVFDNHDLVDPIIPAIAPVYVEMVRLGGGIEFQTFRENPQNFTETMLLGLLLGASAIELYQDYGGFQCVPKPALRQWARWLESGKPGNPLQVVPPLAKGVRGCPPAVAPVPPAVGRHARH